MWHLFPTCLVLFQDRAEKAEKSIDLQFSCFSSKMKMLESMILKRPLKFKFMYLIITPVNMNRTEYERGMSEQVAGPLGHWTEDILTNR